MTEIKEMVGLDNLKEHLQKTTARVEISTRRGVDLKEERFATVFIGYPRTDKLAPPSNVKIMDFNADYQLGKTTVARNHAKYLSASGVVGDGFTETSGVYLSDGGISRAKNYITDLSYSGRVLFVDDAHHLLSYSRGRKVTDYMMQEMEKHAEKWSLS
jgi:hypothetical protein